MTRTYQSAVLEAPGKIRLRRERVPPPAPTQIRVRLEGCGVCGSSLPVWEGRPWFEYPRLAGSPGHEPWGMIEAVGDDVADFRPGDRVAMLAEQAFAEVVLAEASHAVRLPAQLDGQDFPGEALACAMNIIRRSDLLPAEGTVIIGAGFLGCVLTRLASIAGARVIAISRRPYSLEAAAAMGAEHTLVLDDHQRIIDEVREISRGMMCPRVIEATGHQWPLDLAGELCAEGGRLVIAGYHQDGPRQVNMQLWNWRGLEVTNAHERDPATYVEGMNQAVRAVLSGELDPALLYTHRFQIDELPDAFDLLRDRRGNFIKALIRYD
jgi:threonine dehydrogenase-like Zn-dependent dehydrogenase